VTCCRSSSAGSPLIYGDYNRRKIQRRRRSPTIYTLPVIIFGFAFVLLLAILTDLPLWMVGLAALLALFGYLLERRQSS
jgi:fatty acid desaturase